MTLTSTARSLAVLLASTLVLPILVGPMAAQGYAPNSPTPQAAQGSMPNAPAPQACPQCAAKTPACSQCVQKAPACAHCGSRLASLLHLQQTCVHTHTKHICAPCGLKHFGYYPTCWTAWPFPTDYTHCPPPPPPAAAQPPWYDPGNPHPPKSTDDTLHPPTPDLKENGEMKKDKDKEEDLKKDDKDKSKDDKDKSKEDKDKSKDGKDKGKEGQPQTRLLPPLRNYR